MVAYIACDLQFFVPAQGKLIVIFYLEMVAPAQQHRRGAVTDGYDGRPSALPLKQKLVLRDPTR